jgi:four helix bundle protein
MPLPHHSLIVWKRADDLFIRLHRLSQRLPAAERYELGSQLRRAAFSVPVNIVEGLAQKGPVAKRRFLRIASASLAEVGYCLHAAKRLDYISEADYAKLELEVRKVSAPLRGLISSVGSKNPE